MSPVIGSVPSMLPQRAGPKDRQSGRRRLCMARPGNAFRAAMKCSLIPFLKLYAVLSLFCVSE